MPDRETLIVDGYNVIHQSPPMRACLQRSKAAARENLLSFCVEWLSRRRDVEAFWVVFDGDASVPAVPRPAGLPRSIHVIYANSGEKADGRILQLLDETSDPARCVVVTADGEVAGRARARGAQVRTPQRFLGTLRPPTRGTSPESDDDAKDSLSGAARKQITDDLKRGWGVE